jgi:DNA-binding transcriptional MerR regulator
LRLKKLGISHAKIKEVLEARGHKDLSSKVA